MSPGSVVVTGASRGIGLGLVKQLLKDENTRHVIAAVKDDESDADIKEINDPRLHVVPLTVTCDESIETFALKVAEIVGDGGLNLLINNAGRNISFPLGKGDRALLTEQLDVNTVSVVMVTQKLLPLLIKAASKVSGDELSISRAAVITISSGMASISENTTGSDRWNVLGYRMSKTAVNQFMRTLAVDLADDHVLAANFSPGWVRTDMGGPEGKLSVEESTSALVASFNQLESVHNGGFFRRDLSVISF